jgi:hypothetical protein
VIEKRRRINKDSFPVMEARFYSPIFLEVPPDQNRIGGENLKTKNPYKI